MLDILNSHGVTNINAVEIMQGMAKRDDIHFQNSVNNRTFACTVLENCIGISDANLKFGLALHLLELAVDNVNVPVRPNEPLPAATQDLVNGEVREVTAQKQTLAAV